ncbi:MAG: lysylphosphatidylglycerol synthase transmembrane domain-containing protein [Acidobacteriota bacterium]
MPHTRHRSDLQTHNGVDRSPPGVPPDSPPTTSLLVRSNEGRLWSTVLRLIVFALVVFFVWRFIRELGWEQVMHRLGEARSGYVVLATGCLMTRFALIYIRWSMVLRILKLPISHFVAATALMTGVLLNHVTPTARVLGGIVRARGLARIYRAPFSDLYASILVEQLGNQVVQAVLMWIAAIPLAWRLGWHRAASLIAITPPLVLLVFVAGRARKGARSRAPWSSLPVRALQRQFQRLGPIAVGGRRIAEIFAVAFRDVGLQTRLALCGVGVVLSNALALWLVLNSLDTQVPFLYVLATVSLGLTAGLLTGTPGGLATTEAALIALLVALGVPEIDATAGVLLYRGLHYAIVLAAGGISAIAFELTVARTPPGIKSEPGAADSRDNSRPAPGSDADRVG